MPNRTFGRDEIVRYLFGQLTDEEREDFSGRYLEDDELFEEILAVKDELADEYRHGKMTPEDTALFEEFLRKYPPAEHELALARGIERYAKVHREESGAEASEETESSVPAPLIFGYRPQAILNYGLGIIALVAFIGLGWLALRNQRLSGELSRYRDELTAMRETQARSEPTARREDSEEFKRSAERLQAELDKEREVRTNLEKRLRSPEILRSSAPAFAFNLLPSREGVQTRQLILPLQQIPFQITLEADENFKTYSVLLQTQDDGSRVWGPERVKARNRKDKVVLTFAVPANKFSSGRTYKLTVNGIGETGQPEELGYEYFNLVKR